MWVAVHGHVFDLTEFFYEHPGGWEVIEENAGKDGTVSYEEGAHRIESIRDMKQYYIGEYEGKKITMQDKKEQAAKQQLLDLKLRKDEERYHQMVAIFVGVLLLSMIAYFVIQVVGSDSDNKEL